MIRRLLVFALLTSPVFGQVLQTISNNVTHSVAGASVTSGQNAVAASSTLGDATSSYNLWLPNNLGAGNCVIVAMSYQSGTATSVSVADNGSNSYTLTTESAAQSTRLMRFAYASNVAAANKITITFATASPTNVKASAYEVYNCPTSSIIDTSATTTGANASTSVTTGSVTPSLSGYALFACAFRSQTPDNRGTGPYTVGSQSNITWQFATMNVMDGYVCEWGTYASTSAINPELTWQNGSGYVAGTLVIKNATQGTAPGSGIRIRYLQHEQVILSLGATTPIRLQWPTSGNLFALHGIGGSANGADFTISSITDASSNTWVNTVDQSGCVLCAAGAGSPFVWTSTNPTASNSLTLTVNTASGTGTDATWLFYDISGAATSSPVAGWFKGAADQLAAGSLQVLSESQTASAVGGAYTIYPGTDNGLLIGNIGVATNTVNAITTPSSSFFDATYYGGQSLDGPSTGDQNNGWWHFPIAAATAISNITITGTSGAQVFGNYATTNAIYRSSTGSTLATRVQDAFNVSTGTGTTVTRTYTPKAAGNLIAVGCARGTATGTLTLTDTAGNTIVNIDSTTNVTSGSMRTFYVASTVAGANTFTCTASTSTNTTRSIWVTEFTGVTALDGSNHGIRSTTSSGAGAFSSASFTPSVNNTIIWGFGWCNNSCVQGTSYVYSNTDGHGNVAEWKFLGTAASINTDFIDVATSVTEGAAVAVFKP